MSNTKGLITFLERTVTIGLIAAPFAAILISTSTLFPFFVGKVTFLHTVLTITLIAFLFLLALKPDRIRFRVRAITMSVLVYFVIFAISSFTSIDPYQSFWSTIERMEGLFHMLYFLLYFVMLVSFYRTKQEWIIFWRGALIMGWLVGLYGVGQFIGIDGVLLPSTDRIAATLGNATYVGTMFIIMSPIALLLYFWDRQSAWKNMYYASLAFFVLLIVMSGTRGALMGLVAGIGFGSLLYALFSPSSQHKKRAAIGLAVVVLGAAGVLGLARGGYLDGIEAARRLGETSFGTGGVRARIINWEIAWNAAQERPLLGWGPDTYLSIFSRDYNPQMLFYKNIWFDRVHSKQIEVLVTTGYLGLLSYLGIFATILWGFYKTRTQSFFREKVLIGSLLAGYFVQNIPLFDTTTSLVLFFPVIGLSAFLISDNASTHPNKDDPDTHSIRPLPFIGVVILTLTLLVILKIGTFDVYAASRQAIVALRVAHGQPDQTDLFIAEYDKAFAYNSYVNSELYNQLRVLLPNIVERAPAGAVERYARYSVDRLETAVALHPTNLKYRLALGTMYRVLSDIDPAYIDSAQRVLEDAASIGLRPDAYIELSVFKEQRGDLEGAAQVLQEYIDKDESLQTPWRKAQIAFLRGEAEQGEQFITQAIASEQRDFTIDDLFFVRQIGPQSLERLFEFYRDTPNISTDTPEYFSILAILLARGGNGPQAVELLSQAQLEFGHNHSALINRIRGY